MIVPFEAGPLELELSVTYTDDFNQPAVITDTVTIEVMEAEVMEPIEPGVTPEEGMPGGEAPVESGGQETLAQRVWRFILGLLGLGSAPPSSQPVEPGIVPGG
jgi:hypothetical protein